MAWMAQESPVSGGRRGPLTATANAGRRPVGITILAILAALAAPTCIWHVLQYLGVGSTRDTNVLATLAWGATAATWIWAAVNLWNLTPGSTALLPVMYWLARRSHRPQVLIFVILLTGWNLILAVLTILGTSTFLGVLPDILINAIILLYCLSPGVRRSFGKL
jgi:hypothetical protein